MTKQKHKNAKIQHPPTHDKSHTPVSKAKINGLKPKWLFGSMNWEVSSSLLGAQDCKCGKQLSSTNKTECCFHSLSLMLKSFESMTWSEIIRNDSTGSHFIDLECLREVNPKLYKIFEGLAIEDGVDEPFSLRLSSDERLWGIVLSDGTFKALWWYPFHNGYPSKSYRQ